MQNNKSQNLKYLVANSLDELWGVYATTIGSQSFRSNTNYPPKEHPTSYWFNPVNGRVLQEFQIIYIINGEGSFESSSCKTTKIEAGNMIFLFPGEWHTYKPSKIRGWEEYWIGFKGNFINDLFLNNFLSKKNPVLNIGFNEQIINLFKQAIEIAGLQKTGYQHLLAGIICHLIASISYIEKNNAFRDKEAINLIEKARMLMRANADDDLTPQEIAKTLNISYSWFRRIFKQYTGFSPSQYQMEIKIQQSKDLLTISTMTIKQIAFALNFVSSSYFVTFFKSRTGMTPSDYRDKVHGKQP
jgi:AraC-like DNA-binding protein